MKKIEAIISRAADGTFSVYCKKEIFSGMGDTIEAAKEDMVKQMHIYKETAICGGFKYPQFLDEEFALEYTLDAVSVMAYYVRSGFLSIAGMEKLTGIHQKQLWSYLNGSKPRLEQNRRIEQGLVRLSNDLGAMFD